MKKSTVLVALMLAISFNCLSQNDSTKWNIPKKGWFFEIGIPMFGCSMKLSNEGIVTDDFQDFNLNIKLISFAAYFNTKNNNSKIGIGLDIGHFGNNISRSVLDKRLQVINTGYYSDWSVDWGVTSLKLKVRNYTKISRKSSFSFGFGLAVYQSGLGQMIILDHNNASYSKIVDEIYNTNLGFAFDYSHNWDLLKWLSLGIRVDLEYYRIKTNNIVSNYGVYDIRSKANFISITPTINFKL
ncbi:MAG: hypothetical protein WCH34_00485 [Bacteroidota bacterium]